MRVGHTPSTAGTFRKNFRKNSGKTPETLSERFLEFPSRVRLGCPKSYNSRHLRLPEHFQNYLPPSTAGGASFFRIGSGEGLSEPVMEFPAVLGVYLRGGCSICVTVRLPIRGRGERQCTGKQMPKPLFSLLPVQICPILPLYMGKMGPSCHFSRALPASLWGHCSQILVSTSTWGTQQGL